MLGCDLEDHADGYQDHRGGAVVDDREECGLEHGLYSLGFVVADALQGDGRPARAS